MDIVCYCGSFSGNLPHFAADNNCRQFRKPGPHSKEVNGVLYTWIEPSIEYQEKARKRSKPYRRDLQKILNNLK